MLEPDLDVMLPFVAYIRERAEQMAGALARGDVAETAAQLGALTTLFSANPAAAVGAALYGYTDPGVYGWWDDDRANTLLESIRPALARALALMRLDLN